MNDKNNERTMRKRTIGKFCHSKGVNISLGTDCQAFLFIVHSIEKSMQNFNLKGKKRV